MRETAFGAHFPSQETPSAQHVDVEIFNGIYWMSLNDGYKYKLGAGTLANTAQTLNNHAVTSPMFDGEFVIHTTKGNATESIEVYVTGADNAEVSENIDVLVAAFTQSSYKVRRTFGNDVEIWNCWPAEYSWERGHVNIHNVRATVKFNVPRFPKVTREVIA